MFPQVLLVALKEEHWALENVDVAAVVVLVLVVPVLDSRFASGNLAVLQAVRELEIVLYFLIQSERSLIPPGSPIPCPF